MAKLIYKPIGLIVGMVAGLIASKLFDKVWAQISDDEPPEPDERDADWPAVIASAAVSGVIFKVVQALVHRGGAKGFERATGVWPGSSD